MFNKFELIGIGASICAMALALFFLRLDTSFVLLAEDTNQVAQTAGSAVVIVPNNTTDQKATLRDSITQAAGTDGTLQKLILNDVVVGTGDTVEMGDTVSVNYIGTLQNGEEFDNSYKRGTPFVFTVGDGKVIEGWEQGVVGMQVGGKRILVIPSALGYGSKGYGPIPGGASLVFAIELMEIQ